MRMPKTGEGWRYHGTGCPSLFEIVGTGHDVETGMAVVVYRPYDCPSASLRTSPLGAFLGLNGDDDRRIVWERAARDEHVLVKPDSS